MTLAMHLIRKRITRIRSQRNKLNELKSFHKDEDGQAMTEFVIMIPFLLFMILGTIQFTLIANASYFVKLANFYALRTGVVHFEQIQFRLDGGNNLETLMKDEAIRVLLPTMPNFFQEVLNYILTEQTVDLDIGTNRTNNLGGNPNANDTSSWLTCNTEYMFHLYVPFAGGIIANIWWWTNRSILPGFINNQILRQNNLFVRDAQFLAIIDSPTAGIFLWPCIPIKSRNWNFRSTRNPGDNVAWLERHTMAIQRRIYRNPGQTKPYNL